MRLPTTVLQTKSDWFQMRGHQTGSAIGGTAALQQCSCANIIIIIGIWHPQLLLSFIIALLLHDVIAHTNPISSSIILEKPHSKINDSNGRAPAEAKSR